MVQGAQGAVRRAPSWPHDRDDRPARGGSPRVRSGSLGEPQGIALPDLSPIRGLGEPRRRSKRTLPPYSPTASCPSTRVPVSTSTSISRACGSAAGCTRPHSRSSRRSASTWPPTSAFRAIVESPAFRRTLARSKASSSSACRRIPEGSPGGEYPEVPPISRGQRTARGLRARPAFYPRDRARLWNVAPSSGSQRAAHEA